MSSSRRVSLQMNNSHGVLRRSPRRLRTKTPSVNELSKKFKVSPKGKRRLEFKPQEPLRGKRIYLDLQSFRRSDLLISRIKDLGGKVEEFLSKDVSFVITNRKDVDTQSSAYSPSTPSPGMSVPSPTPGTKSSSMKGPSPLSVDSPNSTEPKHDTRGKALMKKATGTQRMGTSGILANARTWGVQLIQLDRFLEKLEQYGGKEKLGSKQVALNNQTTKLSSKPRVRKLNAPFIKVEDLSHHYKPLVHELKEWPQLYFETPVGTCPFDPPKRRGEQNSQVKQRSHKKKGREEKQQKRGYCECCSSHYKDLDLHLKSDHHQAFARDDSNYVNLDALISRGPSLKDFLGKVREKYREKAQRQEQDREDNFAVSSQQQTPEAVSSEDRRNELPGETTPVQTPQGSELDSDESFTRVTRSRSKIDETPKGREQAGSLQPQSDRLLLKEVEASGNEVLSSKDPSLHSEGAETRVSKPKEDEESPTIRVTRSAKDRSTPENPQQAVLGVRLNQIADSKEVPQPQQSPKKGSNTIDKAIVHDTKSSSTVKGDQLSNGTAASEHRLGELNEPEIDKEPSPVEVTRMTRSKKSSSPSVTSDKCNPSSASEHDSGKENAEPLKSQSGNGLPKEHVILHNKKERSVIKSRDDKLSPQSESSKPGSSVNPAAECWNDTQDPQSFTKATRAKAKTLSKENGVGLFTSDNNATQSCDRPSGEITQQGDATSSATSVFGKRRSSPRLAISSTVICAEETKETEDGDSDETESIELSQEPSNPIKTQSMQVMLRDTLSGTSSSTVTIISCCSTETAKTKEPLSDTTDEESIEPPRAYQLRNRSSLPAKEQTTNDVLALLRCCSTETAKTKEPLSDTTDDEFVEPPRAYPLRNRSSLPAKERTTNKQTTNDLPAPLRRKRSCVSAISERLRGKSVPDASVCRTPRRTKHNRNEINPKKGEPSNPSNRPQSGLSMRSEKADESFSDQSAFGSSSPESGPSPPAREYKIMSNIRAKRTILEEEPTSEEQFSDEGTPVKKQGKAKRNVSVSTTDESDSDGVEQSSDKKQRQKAQRKRKASITTSDMSDSDDSLIAHPGTPQNLQDPAAVEEPLETTGDISLQNVRSSPVAAETENDHNKHKQNEEWNIADKLTISASEQVSKKELSFSQLFNSDDDEEDFHGFDVPHFDQSMSSERDLSFHIESIVENMTEKEASPLELMPCEEIFDKSDEGKSTRTLVSDGKKRSRKNEKKGGKGKDIDAISQSNMSNFEQDQESRNCSNRDILDLAMTFGKNVLKTSSTEDRNIEADVCDDEDSSSTVADSTDGEDEEPSGLTPRIELKFGRRKREAEPEFDEDIEIELPAKRSRSQSETCEQSSPPVETRSTKSRKPSQNLREAQELSSLSGTNDNKRQETRKKIRTGNAERETTNEATDSEQPHEYQPIQQDICSEQVEFDLFDEMIFQTLEERVKLRRSKGRPPGKDARKAELIKKSQEGNAFGKREGKIPREQGQNTKKRQESEKGRRSGGKSPIAGVGKHAKTERVYRGAKQSLTNSKSAATSEVSLERRTTGSESTAPGLHVGSKRSAPREAGDARSKIAALRPLRPLRYRSELTAKRAPGVSKTLKPLKPLRSSNSMSSSSSRDISFQSSSSSPCHSFECPSSCATPTGRLRSSASWIYKSDTFPSPSVTPRNGKKTRAYSSTLGPILVTPRRRSRFLRGGDQYEFVDESVDVYDFSG